MEDKRKRLFSGIQPSGCITLGNYLGAVKNWVALQDEFDCLFSVVDLHCITVRQDPKEFKNRSLDFFAMLLAAGIDPKEHVLFFQSHVSCHAEMAWLLNCYTYIGELQRMTQFKDKSAKHADNINAGLMTYPVLMAADILLYQADAVPVGADQKQHLELTRDIAVRFNHAYGDTFKIPEPIIPKVGARIMSLQDPTSKMSKSDPNPKACISILDSPDTIMKKFKSAVTDSEAEIAYREGKDGINNLLSIYSAVTGTSIEDAVNTFAGQGYGTFKVSVAEAVIEMLRPLQERYAEIKNDKAYIESVYKEGAERAGRIAHRTLTKTMKKIGFMIP